MTLPDYRPFLPKPGESKIAGPTARAHAEARTKSPRAKELFGGWKKALEEPWRGITTDGVPLRDLFALRPEGAPTEKAIEAVNALLARLPADVRRRMSFPVDSNMWRNWQNTELYVEDYGLRLEEVSDELREAVMAVLRASLSEEGFNRSRDVMRLNRFLGDLVGGPAVLGEWSYNFCLFGTPSTSEPWGWQLYGHHLCLNCFILGTQMVLTPAFWGAEPAYADAGRSPAPCCSRTRSAPGSPSCARWTRDSARGPSSRTTWWAATCRPAGATSPTICISAARTTTTASSRTRD